MIQHVLKQEGRTFFCSFRKCVSVEMLVLFWKDPKKRISGSYSASRCEGWVTRATAGHSPAYCCQRPALLVRQTWWAQPVTCHDKKRRKKRKEGREKQNKWYGPKSGKLLLGRNKYFRLPPFHSTRDRVCVCVCVCVCTSVCVYVYVCVYV